MICIWSKTATPTHTFVIILSFDIITFLTLFTIIPDSIGPFGRGHLAVFHAVQSILQAEAVGTGMESMFLDAASAVHDVGSAVRNTGSTVYNAALIVESILQIVGAALRSVFSGSFARSRLPATSTGTGPVIPLSLNRVVGEGEHSNESNVSPPPPVSCFLFKCLLFTHYYYLPT